MLGLVLGGALMWALSASSARAQGLSLIRDSEIEITIRGWADPILVAAGLDPAAVRILLVNDPSLNAFVAGGQNIFLHTGLLMATESPGQAIGVIAHEAGHISGGHLARSAEGIRAAENTSLIATLLGIGAIALGAGAGVDKAGTAGAALVVGGQSAGFRRLLAYTRTQERAADQAAVDMLERAQQSARGLLEFLGALEDQELLVSERQDPYVRSHPLTSDRIAFISNAMAHSPWSDVPDPPEEMRRHERMRAKLIGFLERPRRVLRTLFPLADESLPARYARAVAYMRLADLDAALGEIDILIREHPDDPWFVELKGQILFEHGRVRDALPHYRRAARLVPEEALILAGLARVQVEIGGEALLREAVDNLEAARRLERDDPTTWRLLAAAHHGLGEAGLSALAAGEYALLTGRPDDAARHAERAERAFPEGSPEWLQARDIATQAERIQELRAGG